MGRRGAGCSVLHGNATERECKSVVSFELFLHEFSFIVTAHTAVNAHHFFRRVVSLEQGRISCHSLYAHLSFSFEPRLIFSNT